MKRIYFLLIACVASLLPIMSLSAQQVKWQSSVEWSADDECQIVLEATIPSGYHMYDMGPYDVGVNATTITFKPAEGVTYVGDVMATAESHKAFNEGFNAVIGTYEGTARFVQRVHLSQPQATVQVELEWMICNDVSCVPPDDATLTITLTPPSAAETTIAEVSPTADSQEPEKDESLWAFILEAILWGFAAMLTPCVFPMIPMTVSYFLKGEGGVALGRLRAALYGFFIVALYTVPIAVIILVTRLVGGDAVTADIFNWLATHWLPNVIFFAVFMLFAASFFGAFEITMPSWLVNKSDSKADTKGVGGIFFLALTLVLVSFSCTGPIVGSVLIKSTAGEFWTPILTMLAFSVAFALPFTIFAFFPQVLKKLPKSGGWLNSVKVVIGFIEMALGLKFLSVADQTYHWGLLDREVYLAIWIVVFSLLGLYLLGKIKFAYDSDVPYLGVPRLALAIAVFSFVVYMIPGMWGAPLKTLSGYLPPITTQDFVVGQGSAQATPTTSLEGRTKYSDFLHLPHGLAGFFDLDEAEAWAAKVHKPLFVDFTGHGCVNCREMEARVWSDPQVLELLRNEYVVVALYSDDKKELPESDWVTTESGTVLKTLGKINSYVALTRYGINAQPCYILQGDEGRRLLPARGYDLDVQSFIDFLKTGVAAYHAE